MTKQQADHISNPTEDKDQNSDVAHDEHSESATVDESDKTVESNNPNKEAAKYRRQLREVEAERDQLKESLQTIATNTLDDRLARYNTFTYTPDPNGPGNVAMKEINGKYLPKEVNVEIKLRNPSDFLPLSGLTIDDLRDENGLLDNTKLQDALIDLYTNRPELFHTPDKPVKTVGKQPTTSTVGTTKFESAFTRK